MSGDNEDLSLDEQALVGLVDQLADRFGIGYWQRCREEGQFPRELWQALAKAGILGIPVPPEYGGVGLGLVEMALVQERLAHRGMPLLLLVVGPGLSFLPIVHHGTKAQLQRYLTPCATGERVLCFGVTEPEAGSNTFEIQTRASRVETGFTLTGHKTFISGANHADDMLVVCRARSGGATVGREELSLILVDLHAKGVTVRPQSMRVMSLEQQCDVYFDQVAVASDQVVGEVGHGADYLFEGLNAERINVAALAVGLGRYVIRQAVAYANRRTVFGNKPIGSYQALQHPLAEAFTHIEAAWLLTLKAARAYDAQRSAAGWANLAKLAAVDAALQACDVAIEVHGGNGFTTDYDLLSVWSLCRLLKTAPVSRELVLNYIGVHVLGLPPSS